MGLGIYGAHLTLGFFGIDKKPTVVAARFDWLKGRMMKVMADNPLSFSDAKHQIRQRLLAERDALSPDWRAAASCRLLDYIEVFGDVRGKIISSFWPIRSEIDPRPLVHALQAQGAQLALPAALDRETIVFRAFDKADRLIEERYGTKAPHESMPVLDPDIMIVPLAAFDAAGGRVGYGGGYYDRAIARLIAKGRPPLTIGLAFGLQQVANLPQEKTDMRLNRIVTPDGVIDPTLQPALAPNKNGN